jgi:broad-specificity NMP kinase
MKRLIFIGGTMGIGKTTVSQVLKKEMSQSVFLDGDWCWDMSPFIVNEETKAMVMDNICYLLNNYLQCSQYENVIFCWVMHEQAIIDEILSRLDLSFCHVYVFSLICSKEKLEANIQKDICQGKRQKDVLKRSLERLSCYEFLNTIHIDTTFLTVNETVSQIKEMIMK